MTTTYAPPHWHGTIGEAGKCPECRAFNIEFVRGAPNVFRLGFVEEDGSRSEALVRSWSPVLDEAADVAWATGCNPGGHVIIARIDDPGDVEGLPFFELLADDGD
jgi:hypothetical protein